MVGDLYMTENHQVNHMNISMLQRVMCVLRITISSESKVLKTDSYGISFFFFVVSNSHRFSECVLCNYIKGSTIIVELCLNI